MTRVLDVGISSGITSIELFNAFEAVGTRAQMTCTDLFLDAEIRTAGWCETLLQRDDYVIQVAMPGLVRCRPHDPSGHWMRALLDSAMTRIGSAVTLMADRRTPVQLVSRALLTLPAIEVREWDVFVDRPEWHRAFDVVRAANVLNTDYFGDEQLVRAVGMLRRYLTPQGLLVLNRTDDHAHRNDGSIMRADGVDELRVCARVGRGSELEPMLRGARMLAGDGLSVDVVVEPALTAS
jgi:hypothetical protein